MNNQNDTFAYEGHCAFAVSTGKTDVKGGKSSLTINGKKYLFSNPIAKFLFKVLPKRVEKADVHWGNSKK